MSTLGPTDVDNVDHAERGDAPGPSKRMRTKGSEKRMKKVKREGTTRIAVIKWRRERMFWRHERFWLPDGDVVLELQSIQFNLHQSRLASQSPWFKALFDAQTKNPHYSRLGGFDGVEIDFLDNYNSWVICINKQDVSPEDFAALLAAMYESASSSYAAPGFAAHAAIFKAASILDFPTYRASALQAMEEEFSPNLDTVTTERKSNAAKAVEMGHKPWSLTQLYKRAFYEIECQPDAASREWRILDHDIGKKAQTLKVFNLQKRLCTAWTEVLLPRRKYSCTTMEACASDDLANYWAPIQDGIMSTFALDPICGLEALASVDWAKYGHCTACTERRRAEFADKRVKLWKDMDEWL
ncbi:hypothetical protein K525DRAFT_271272 [Schizophyllum commune Loenen D]|nr:hypothetical protein K525DRAFT_271272 [Schizophyllum commune Loenen D]